MIGQVMIRLFMQLCNEMSRITGLEDLCGVARERWKTYVPKILDQSKIETPHNNVLSKALSDYGPDQKAIGNH